MKEKTLIIKNITREGLGLLEDVLKEYNIGYTIVDLSTVQNFPPIKNFKAVVVLGGPDSANDNNLKMQTELSYIRSVLDANIPYLGICLGLQIMVKAAGGNVIKSHVKEAGFKDIYGKNFTVELTEEGKIDPLFDGLKSSFNVFHLHGETVELTDDIALLAEGKYCKNQIVKIGSNAYGIQSHFELTQEMLEQWINEDPDLFKFDKDELKKDFKSLKIKYIKTGTKLFTNFLQVAGFLT
ncbi:MAG: type 1 glutamine amidotransferase [Ignavibacteriales bacterium]|nr:MAG: type 1 glutamine amidotransferase [Ignavibacteriales bacterium]